MKSWINNPRIAVMRERVISSLNKPRQSYFRRLNSTVFLCGADNSSRRDALRDYLKKRHESINLFYAEKVWDHLSQDKALSALKMESELGKLSDLIVIVVESPGTFAELGAFSENEHLRKKLLPILDVEYKNANSFISTGPVRWVDLESSFKPSIYAPLARILECVHEVEDRIAKIPKPKGISYAVITTSPKHLLYFLCDLIGVIGPATIHDIKLYTNRIIPSPENDGFDIHTLVALGTAMGLLESKKINDEQGDRTFYYSAEPDAISHPYHNKSSANLSMLRAEYVSALLSVPDAASIIRRIIDSR